MRFWQANREGKIYSQPERQFALFTQSKATGQWIYDGVVLEERHAKIFERVREDSKVEFRVIDLDAIGRWTPQPEERS